MICYDISAWGEMISGWTHSVVHYFVLCEQFLPFGCRRTVAAWENSWCNCWVATNLLRDLPTTTDRQGMSLPKDGNWYPGWGFSWRVSPYENYGWGTDWDGTNGVSHADALCVKGEGKNWRWNVSEKFYWSDQVWVVIEGCEWPHLQKQPIMTSTLFLEIWPGNFKRKFLKWSKTVRWCWWPKYTLTNGYEHEEVFKDDEETWKLGPGIFGSTWDEWWTCITCQGPDDWQFNFLTSNQMTLVTWVWNNDHGDGARCWWDDRWIPVLWEYCYLFWVWLLWFLFLVKMELSLCHKDNTPPTCGC